VRGRFIVSLATIGTLLIAGTARATLAPPRFGHSVDIGLVSGTVVVTPPRGHPFTLGTQDRSIPTGSLIDTTDGRVDLRAARPPSPVASFVHLASGSQIEDAQFYDGAFRVMQSPSSPVAQIRLVGGNTSACGAPSSDLVPHRRPPHRIERLLWASGPGKFETVGRYSAATVLGTRWLTEDFCDGTLVRVVQGVVVVKDLATRATVTVHAGHSQFTAAATAARH
jgi:hypothetical protein